MQRIIDEREKDVYILNEHCKKLYVFLPICPVDDNKAFLLPLLLPHSRHTDGMILA